MNLNSKSKISPYFMKYFKENLSHLLSQGKTITHPRVKAILYEHGVYKPQKNHPVTNYTPPSAPALPNYHETQIKSILGLYLNGYAIDMEFVKRTGKLWVDKKHNSNEFSFSLKFNIETCKKIIYETTKNIIFPANFHIFYCTFKEEYLFHLFLTDPHKINVFKNHPKWTEMKNLKK